MFFGKKVVSIHLINVIVMGADSRLGWPELNKNYFDKVIMNEDVHMACYLLIAVLANSMTMQLMCWAPIVIHGIFV